MQSLLLPLWYVLAGVAALQAFVTALQSWEHRRFARSRMKGLHKNAEPTSRVRVCAPCKGIDLGLASNLARLFEQDHSNFEIVFIVESGDDPVTKVIRACMAKYPDVDTRLIVAGRATESGQKVHNLRMATAAMPNEIEVLVFVDSDARPNLDWLRILTQRLDRPDVGATTAYRWFVPTRATLANHLLCSINSAVAAFFGPGSHHLVWGGSWAIRREIFDSIGLHQAWYGTVSDDLVASRVLHRNRLRVEYEPKCLVASPLDHSFPQLFEFIRRQYVIARFCISRLWYMTFFFATLSVIAFFSSVALGVYFLLRGDAWAAVPLGVVAFLYGFGVLKAVLRQETAQLSLPLFEEKLKNVRRFDYVAGPLVSVVNWIGMLSALFGSSIIWRGVRYRIFPGGQSQTLNREVVQDQRWVPRPHQSGVKQQKPFSEARDRASRNIEH